MTNLPRTDQGFSRHELPAGVYKLEFLTIPPLVAYATVDQQRETTIGIVRSGLGLDLYDRAHLALGNRYYDNGQIEEAMTEYQKVLDFDSQNINAHLNMGIIYQDILNDKEQAANHYKIYLELQGPRQEEVSAGCVKYAVFLQLKKNLNRNVVKSRKQERKKSLRERLKKLPLNKLKHATSHCRV